VLAVSATCLPRVCHVPARARRANASVTKARPAFAGMGCSASPISIDLAKQLLQLHPSTYALVVSTENITQVTRIKCSSYVMNTA
jgi:hypothetical protein